MNLESPKNSELDNKTQSDFDDIDISQVLYSIKRRKRFIFSISSFIFILISLYTGYQRIFRPTYIGSFKLLISDPISNNGQKRTQIGGEGVFESVARNTTDNDIPTLRQFLKSPLVINEVSKASKNVDTPSIISNLSINTIGKRASNSKGIIKVSLTSRNKKEGLKLLKSISDTYLELALVQKQKRLSDGLEFLNNQSPALQKRKNDLEDQLARFRIDNLLLEPSAEGLDLKNRENFLDNSISNIKTEINKLKNVRKEIEFGRLSATGFQEATGSKGDGLVISGSDNSIFEEVLEIESELAKVRLIYKETAPNVIMLESKLSKFKPILKKQQLNYVDTALKLNEGKLINFEKQKSELSSIFMKQPLLIKKYNSIEEKLEIAKQNLAGLNSAKEKFQLEMAQESVPWRIIAPPVFESSPIQPNVQRNIILGFFGGIFIGLIAGLIRDRMDYVFRNVRDLEESLNVPLLGHIPFIDFFVKVREEGKLLLEEINQNEDIKSKENSYQRFFYQEAFRNIFTSIRYLSADTNIKKIIITSSIPAEGKSLVNILLSKTLAEMGKKILLIDADLRKPQIHKRLGINNFDGLSNILTENKSDWKKYIKKVKDFKGWDVITAGIRPPDPTRLLSSKKMINFSEELTKSEEYDYVIFDAPPVLGLSDAILVSENCDGLILLISLGRVNRNAPKDSLKRIASNNIQVLGAITNSVAKDSERNASNSYGYGYGKYGYGYQYGYHSYDTSAAYTYYNDGDLKEDTESIPFLIKIRLYISQEIRNLLRWIDQ